jgi:hypothetical protein
MSKNPEEFVFEREAMVEARTDNESAPVYKGKLRLLTSFADKSARNAGNYL